MVQAACVHITLSGIVQGVGFRPFLYRLAQELGLNGCVCNTPEGVVMEAEGPEEQIERLLDRIPKEKPPHSLIQTYEYRYIDPVGYDSLVIEPSRQSGSTTTLVLPDIATCPDCLAELFDLSNRRYLYPFTNCTHCGPRFSIIHGLPYDRPNTTMNGFAMCPDCLEEYHNPLDRRFHAQPNACSQCGPQLALWDDRGHIRACRLEALQEAALCIREGDIVAVKGIGGFQLFVDAYNESAVNRLRRRKHREEKPFALMMPSLAMTRDYCRLSLLEEELLLSPQAPIVLLERREGIEALPLADSIAPNNPYLGVMLPYSPLHHVLMRILNTPCIATSGNLSDEPICIDEHDAVKRLYGLADVLLAHDRPIVRHVDDSVVRVVGDRPMILRRARGYAPFPVSLGESLPPTLAVGAHLKNTVALNTGRNVFISQHIGDLETAESHRAFEVVIGSLESMYNIRPTRAACDLHSDYLSSQFAQKTGLPVTQVQHHYAHVLSCMAENDLLNQTVLGVSWDGTGLGMDGTIWGGEFLLCTRNGFRRVAHLRTFPMPSGDGAVKEPRRTALGVLYELFGDEAFPRTDLPTLQAFASEELKLLRSMLKKNLNSPRTSSAGRLFDAISSLIGLRQKVAFEGQAAMELEFAVRGVDSGETYPFTLNQSSTEPRIGILDWQPMVEAVLHDLALKENQALISARFHNTLVEMIVTTAKRAANPQVVLSGGCFQNRYLTERAIMRLRQEGFTPYWHQSVPTNDGGISLGQLIAASAKESTSCA